MKTLWITLSAMAIANLLALAGFLMWLKSSDRLDRGRLEQVRQLISKPISTERAEKEADAKKLESDKQAAEEAAKASRPPLTASEALAARLEAGEIDRQRIEALRSAIRALQDPLKAEREALTAEKRKFQQEQAAFRAQVASHDALQADQQFKKTLGVLEALKPTEAKSLLMEILKGAEPSTAADKASAGSLMANTPTQAAPGAPGQASITVEGMQRAVDYLNAMQARARAKVMSELLKDDSKLASQLLERLRTYGQIAQAGGSTSNGGTP